MCGSPSSLCSHAASRRDLPMPDSPDTSTIWPSPAVARAEHLPDLDRLREPFQLQGAKLAKLEQIANQAARSRGDDDRAGLSQGLQPCGKIWGLADHGLLLR